MPKQPSSSPNPPSPPPARSAPPDWKLRKSRDSPDAEFPTANTSNSANSASQRNSAILAWHQMITMTLNEKWMMIASMADNDPTKKNPRNFKDYNKQHSCCWCNTSFSRHYGSILPTPESHQAVIGRPPQRLQLHCIAVLEKPWVLQFSSNSKKQLEIWST